MKICSRLQSNRSRKAIKRVFRQREVIRNLQAAGLETKVNEDVLRLFERLLAKS
jgi:hypothetical protein